MRMASQNDANFEKFFLQKNSFSSGKNNDFQGSGDRSLEPKSIANRLQSELKIEVTSDIPVELNVSDLGSVWGSNSGQVGAQDGPRGA